MARVQGLTATVVAAVAVARSVSVAEGEVWVT